VRGLAVAHEAAALVDGALVPRHADPLQVGGDRGCAAVDVPGRVGVVDPQEECPAVPVGEPPVGPR